MITASQRLGAHRFRHESAEEVLRDPYPLLDKELTPEAEAARNTITLTFLEPAERRAEAVFLECEAYENTLDLYGDTMARILMGALPMFVRELGGQLVAARRFQLHTGHVLNPLQSTVKVEGRQWAILTDGHLFILLPEERVVVSAKTEDAKIYYIEVRSSKNSADFLARWKAFARRHNHLRGQAFFADGELIERRRTYSWDDIVLSGSVRQAIETHVEGFLRNREPLRQLGLKVRRGLILEGPPGTGKTLLGKVLADTLNGVSFLWVSPRHIKNPADFDDILQVARFVAPTVLFFEDLDLFGEDRDGHGGMALGELMNQLDGAVDNEDIVTIATTNRLEVVEKALRNRPGRFDRVLTLDEMDAPCRRRMLARLLAKADVSDEDMAFLVSATKGYTGAQMTELANTLFILAVERNEGASGNDDGKVSGLIFGRPLIAAALDEFRVELKARVGFHAD